jgi:hypothetical protein
VLRDVLQRVVSASGSVKIERQAGNSKGFGPN